MPLVSYEAGPSHATNYEAGPSRATSYEAGPSRATSYKAVASHATSYEVVPSRATILNSLYIIAKELQLIKYAVYFCAGTSKKIFPIIFV